MRTHPTKSPWRIPTPPTDRPSWVELRWRSHQPYARIATYIAGNPEDPRNWDFDSKQVNMSLLNKIGRDTEFADHHAYRVTAWRELDYPHQEDPANLGQKKRTPLDRESVTLKTTLF